MRPSYRTALMAAGQPLLYWVSGRDPRHPAGLHGRGQVTGPVRDDPDLGPVVPVALRLVHPPVLRAELLTGSRSTFLRQAVAGGAGEQASSASDTALWWPPTKVAAPYLAPYLERLDRGASSPAAV